MTEIHSRQDLWTHSSIMLGVYGASPDCSNMLVDDGAERPVNQVVEKLYLGIVTRASKEFYE